MKDSICNTYFLILRENEQYLEEIEEIKDRIKILKETIDQKNEVVVDSSTINLIYEKLKTEDLSNNLKIRNYLTKIGKSGESWLESIKCLRVSSI